MQSLASYVRGKQAFILGIQKKNSSGVGGCSNAVSFTSVPEEHVLGGSLDPDLESKAIAHIQPSVTQSHTPQKFLRDFSPFSNVVSSF